MSSVEGFLFTSVIILISSIVQGTVGFGFSLIAVPLLSLVLPMQVVVPMIVCYSLVTNLMIVTTAKKHINIRRIWVMIICGIIGIPIGVYGLQNLNPEILKVIVGVLIITTSLIMMKGYKITFKKEKLSYGFTGFISGVLNGSLSMSGPPIVLFLSNQGYDKDEFRANLTLYAIITNIITIIVYIYSNLLTFDMLGVMGVNIITLLIGSYIGIRVASKIQEEYFRKIVLLLLSIISLVTIFKVII